jgi:hypothetical protein
MHKMTRMTANIVVLEACGVEVRYQGEKAEHKVQSRAGRDVPGPC